MIRRLLLGGVFLSLCIPSVAEAITIAPTKQTVVLTPEQTSQVQLFVVNDENTQQQYTPEIDAFQPDSRGEFPVFGQHDEAERWFSVSPDSLTLAPGERGTFTFDVIAPAGSEPGVHYIALFAAQAAPEGSQVAVATRAGSLVYLYVEGDIVEQLLLEQFDTNTSWTRTPSIDLFLQTENVGNIHVIPTGEVVVKNWKDKVLQRAAINESGKKVLANSRWQESATLSLDRKQAIGKNRVQLFVQYGLADKALVGETVFWYLPTWALVTGTAILLFILAMIRSLFRRR